MLAIPTGQETCLKTGPQKSESRIGFLNSNEHILNLKHTFLITFKTPLVHIECLRRGEELSFYKWSAESFHVQGRVKSRLTAEEGGSEPIIAPLASSGLLHYNSIRVNTLSSKLPVCDRVIDQSCNLLRIKFAMHNADAGHGKDLFVTVLYGATRFMNPTETTSGRNDEYQSSTVHNDSQCTRQEAEALVKLPQCHV